MSSLCQPGFYYDESLGCESCDPLCMPKVQTPWRLKHCKKLCKDVYVRIYEAAITSTTSTSTSAIPPTGAPEGPTTTVITVSVVLGVVLTILVVAGLVYGIRRCKGRKRKQNKTHSNGNNIELGLMAQSPRSPIRTDRVRHHSAPGQLQPTHNQDKRRYSPVYSSRDIIQGSSSEEQELLLGQQDRQEPREDTQPKRLRQSSNESGQEQPVTGAILGQPGSMGTHDQSIPGSRLVQEWPEGRLSQLVTEGRLDRPGAMGNLSQPVSGRRLRQKSAADRSRRVPSEERSGHSDMSTQTSLEDIVVVKIPVQVTDRTEGKRV